MPKKLIDLPCSVGELRKQLDNFSSQDVVVLHLDDSLHVFPVEEDKLTHDHVEQLKKFVRDLEAAHKASANSKLVFK